MGAGKTTIGRLVADAVGWGFVDLDAWIERDTGMSIGDIFRLHGELAFRAMESRSTSALSSVERTVIATGGGWVMDPANVERLAPGSCIVWLRVTAGEAVRRVRDAAVERPLLAGVADSVAEAARLMEQRRERYAATAHVVIDVDGLTPAQIIEQIRSRIRFQG